MKTIEALLHYVILFHSPMQNSQCRSAPSTQITRSHSAALPFWKCLSFFSMHSLIWGGTDECHHLPSFSHRVPYIHWTEWVIWRMSDLYTPARTTFQCWTLTVLYRGMKQYCITQQRSHIAHASLVFTFLQCKCVFCSALNWCICVYKNCAFSIHQYPVLCLWNIFWLAWHWQAFIVLHILNSPIFTKDGGTDTYKIKPYTLDVSHWLLCKELHFYYAVHQLGHVLRDLYTI